MQRTLKLMRWATAIGTLLILALLAWQCVDIYLIGNAPENLDENGVRLQSIYRMEDVAVRLSSLMIPFVAYGALVAVTALLHVIHERSIEGRRASSQKQPGTKNAGAEGEDAYCEGCKQHIGRIVVLVLAVLFIVLGVMNGGWYDVLVKAINICTECIGLG